MKILFNEKGRFDWKTFPDFMEMPGELDQFIETDCLCGAITVCLFDNGESLNTITSMPPEIGQVTSLCEIKNLLDDVSEYRLQALSRGYSFGTFVMYIEDKFTGKERFLRDL